MPAAVGHIVYAAVYYRRLAAHCVEWEGAVGISFVGHFVFHFDSWSFFVADFDPFDFEFAVVCAGLKY